MNKASNLIISALVLAFGLVPEHTGAQNASDASPQRVLHEGTHRMKININIGGKTLTATLADNATALVFASVLPLTVSMSDLFGREKYADSPRALSEAGPRENRYEIGEIAYWSPARQFAVYYHQDGKSIPSPGIIPIAKIDAGTEAFEVSGSVKVDIELDK